MQTEVSSATRAVRNFFHLGGAISLAEVENMAALSGGVLPEGFQVFWGVFWCILRHTEKHTDLLEKRLIIKIIIGC